MAAVTFPAEQRENMKRLVKKLLRSVLPLALRKKLAIWINRQSWIAPGDRGYWATELLEDFASADVNAYHKFLWLNHLAYADTYEIPLRFGYENFNESRRIFFAELPDRLREAGIASPREIDSIFEVGCSLGYLLRYMETDMFPDAHVLEGIDIDEYAIADGMRYLRGLGSKIQLHHGDMERMDDALAGRRMDLVIASGVLLYLDEPSARRLVAKMLAVTSKLLAVTALAHPDVDNAELEESVVRERDGTWIHNVDAMIEAAGGRIVARRCEVSRMVDGNTIYFLYAVPGAASRQ